MPTILVVFFALNVVGALFGYQLRFSAHRWNGFLTDAFLVIAPAALFVLAAAAQKVWQRMLLWPLVAIAVLSSFFSLTWGNHYVKLVQEAELAVSNKSFVYRAYTKGAPLYDHDVVLRCERDVLPGLKLVSTAFFINSVQNPSLSMSGAECVKYTIQSTDRDGTSATYYIPADACLTQRDRRAKLLERYPHCAQ